MNYLRAIATYVLLGWCSIVCANTVMFTEQDESWNLVLQKQHFNQSLVQVFEQEKGAALNPKFLYQSQGQLHTLSEIDGKLHFVFPKSVFVLTEEKTFRLVKKAASKEVFVGVIKVKDELHWLMKNTSEGHFLTRIEGKEASTTLSVMAPWQKNRIMPWAMRNGSMGLMVFFEEPGKLEFLELFFHNGEYRLKQENLDGFGFSSFSEDSVGLWLMPREGTAAKLWQNQKLLDVSLRPLPSDYKQWLAKMKLGREDLYAAQDGKGLQLHLGDEKAPLNTEQAQTEEVEPLSGRQVMEQLVLFFLLILSFVLFIQWRSRFHQQLILKSDRKVVWIQKPSPIFTRGLAFFMDLYFVSLPTIFAASQIFKVEIERFQFSEILAMQAKGHMSPEWVEQLQSLTPVALTLLFIYTLYHVLMERYFGGSLGKLFFRLKVISLDGERPSWKQCLLRAVMRMFDLTLLPFSPSIFFIFIFPLRQSLGDKVAKTQVVLETPN